MANRCSVRGTDTENLWNIITVKYANEDSVRFPVTLYLRRTSQKSNPNYLAKRTQFIALLTRVTRIRIYLLLLFFSLPFVFPFFFLSRNCFVRGSFGGRGGGTKSQGAKSSETREEYIRADPIRGFVEKRGNRLKLNPLKGISACVHSCTLAFAADSFRALAPLLHIKIKKSLFKFNPRFSCGVSCGNARAYIFLAVSKHARLFFFLARSLCRMYRCVSRVRLLYLPRAVESVNVARKKTSKVGVKPSLHGGVQFRQDLNRFCVSFERSKERERERESILTKLTQHGAHVRVRPVEVDGAIRALERRVLAE